MDHDIPVHAHHQDAVLVVGLTGDVDLGTVRPVADMLISMTADRPEAVVVDLHEVTFLGSIAITLLLDAQQYAEQLGIPFAATTTNRAVLRPLQVTGADQVLSIHSTLSGALERVS